MDARLGLRTLICTRMRASCPFFSTCRAPLARQARRLTVTRIESRLQLFCKSSILAHARQQASLLRLEGANVSSLSETTDYFVRGYYVYTSPIVRLTDVYR